VLLPLMKRTMTISLDTDWFWRRAAVLLFKIAERALGSIGKLIAVQRTRLQNLLHQIVVRYLGQPHTADSQERAVFARSWPVGTTALWIAALLSAYVLMYYL
jgi:multicomponent Na+:H+ antiporter subunit D